MEWSKKSCLGLAEIGSFVFMFLCFYSRMDTSCDVIMENNFPWRPHWEILARSLPFLLILLNLCLPLNTGINLSKIGESKSAAWSLMYLGRKSVTKVGSFPPIFEKTKFL